MVIFVIPVITIAITCTTSSAAHDAMAARPSEKLKTEKSQISTKVHLLVASRFYVRMCITT